jgi:hypothetical protein
MTSEGVFSEVEARALAEDLLEKAAPWVIVEVREFPVGWVIIWDLQSNLETTKIDDMVSGCAPILVDRHAGSAHFTGTARPIEEYVDRYEKRESLNEDWRLLAPWGQPSNPSAI